MRSHREGHSLLGIFLAKRLRHARERLIGADVPLASIEGYRGLPVIAGRLVRLSVSVGPIEMEGVRAWIEGNEVGIRVEEGCLPGGILVRLALLGDLPRRLGFVSESHLGWTDQGKAHAFRGRFSRRSGEDWFQERRPFLSRHDVAELDGVLLDPAELELAKILHEQSVPMVVVITTAVSDQGFRAEVRDAFHSASNVVRVNSEPYVMDEGLVAPVRGLDALVEVTMEVVPKGQKNAFASAQRIKVDLKANRSRAAIVTAAGLAAAAGAVPIPFSDAIAIVPIEVTMIATISAIFGLDVTTGFLTTLVTSLLGATSGTVAGKALVGGLLKLIPGLGSVTGGMISAGVAATLTTTLGEAYISVLKNLIAESPDRPLNGEEIAQALREWLKR